MPIPIFYYQCCKCEKVYPDQDDAIGCEDSHFELGDFAVSFVSKENALNFDFPKSFHITNQKNNELALYVFTKTIIKPKIKRWPKNIDDYYNKKYGFPGEEEDG